MKNLNNAMAASVTASHDALDGVEQVIAPHGDLAEAMTQSGYPQDQVQGARLADMVTAFRGVVAAVRALLPSREEVAQSEQAQAPEHQPAPAPDADPRIEGFKVEETVDGRPLASTGLGGDDTTRVSRADADAPGAE